MLCVPEDLRTWGHISFMCSILVRVLLVPLPQVCWYLQGSSGFLRFLRVPQVSQWMHHLHKCLCGPFTAQKKELISTWKSLWVRVQQSECVKHVSTSFLHFYYWSYWSYWSFWSNICLVHEVHMIQSPAPVVLLNDDLSFPLLFVSAYSAFASTFGSVWSWWMLVFCSGSFLTCTDGVCFVLVFSTGVIWMRSVTPLTGDSVNMSHAKKTNAEPWRSGTFFS